MFLLYNVETCLIWTLWFLVRKLSDNSKFSDNFYFRWLGLLKYLETKKTREIDDFWPSRVFFCTNTWLFNIKKNQIDIIQGKKWRCERFWHIFPAMFFWYKIHDSNLLQIPCQNQNVYPCRLLHIWGWKIAKNREIEK